MSEYYIRQPDEDEARGPYSVPKIADLLETGRANRETLYYDEAQDDWVALIDNPGLRDVLFPDKRILHLKSKDLTNSLEQEDDRAPSVTVDEMLAAAEGMTEDTKHLKSKGLSMEKAASLSLPALGIIMALSAVANLYPGIDLLRDVIADREFGLILQNPLLALGIIDAFLALCCFLSVTDVFPILRFRAMAGLGYFAYIFWAWGEYPEMAAVAAGSLAVYTATLTLNFALMVICVIVGIAGMGALAALTIMG